LFAVDKNIYLYKTAYDTEMRKVIIFHSSDFVVLTSSSLQHVKESDDIDDDDGRMTKGRYGSVLRYLFYLILCVPYFMYYVFPLPDFETLCDLMQNSCFWI